jgi:excisionase family DNA binding protein
MAFNKTALNVNSCFTDTKLDSNSESPLIENPIGKEWLTTKEAAHYLGITPNAIRIMVHREKLKSYKLNGRLRFKLRDLRSILKFNGGAL